MRPLLLLALLVPTDGPVLTLPDGQAAKVWAGIGPETVPAGLTAPPGDWGSGSTWQRWAELVQAEASAEEHDPAQRAALCLLARSHGRAADAWGHYQALGAEPSWVAAVTPALLPGIPRQARVEAGGRPAPLPDGVLLTPFLPPSTQKGPAGAVEWRTAKSHRLRIGAAVVDLTITVEATGVQVDLTHLEGGPASVQVLLPQPEGFEIRVEYLDWIRREDEDLRTPIPVQLLPGEETHQLYGRILEQRSELPTGPATRLPAALVHGGLTFEVPAGDPDEPYLSEIAGVVSSLLEVEVRLAQPGVAPDTRPGLTFRLPPGQERLGRLRFLASAIEDFLLP